MNQSSWHLEQLFMLSEILEDFGFNKSSVNIECIIVDYALVNRRLADLTCLWLNLDMQTMVIPWRSL